MTYQPVPIPSQVPDRLTITLWDFSWYVRTGPGEPFEDLDRAFAEAVERGYNTVRICAMPFLLFGSGLDTTALRLGPLGGPYGQRVRWYDVGAPTVIDARAHLLALFEAARRHDCFVIVSSWEYQQSSSFSETSEWFDRLIAIDPEDRAESQAMALAELVDFLAAHDLADRIAFVEVHNEVQAGHLTEGLPPGSMDDRVVALRPRLERAVAAFHARQPTVPVTVNYAHVPVGGMRGIPETIDVLVTHPYVYGVLDAFIAEYGLRGTVAAFDQDKARDILRPGAPPIESWGPDADWRRRATIISAPEIYVHDNGDAEAIDRWLYRHFPAWEQAMYDRLSLWLDAARDWGAAHDVPIVFGEGWVGYTPRDGRFEEGPIGAELCRRAIDESIRVGAWGTIVCSNAAPQHAMWADVALQQQCNTAFTRKTPIRTA
jgi:hypothetical protein